MSEQTIAHFIQGQFSTNDDRIPVVEPATGQSYANVADGTADDVQKAVEAAKAAFPSWSRLPASERSRLLLRIADRIEENLEELAQLESRDTGKPIRLARMVDIPRAAANFRFFATAILHAESESYETDQLALNYVTRHPRGVAGLISPWNLPLYLLSWKIAPALASGCTAVAKPSEETPRTAMRLAEICQEIDLPAGALNIVHGRGAVVGRALVEHPDVTTISFTGGTVTGAEIARVAAPMFKRLTLELGGKNPNIVFADADLDEALDGTIRAAFSNQGQICLCGSRLFVEQSIYESFVERVIEATKGLHIGDPIEESTDVGALISKQHREKVLSYLRRVPDEGGRIACGGKVPDPINERCRDGFFLEPTVLTNLDAHCPINQEEIFGPVVSIIPFEKEQDVIEWANATPFGLSASLWTRDLDRAHRVSSQLETGTVWVNCWLLRDLRTPFGGVKQSGIGREGGKEALHFFTEPRTVCIKLHQASTS